jgi:hypothetical protein
MKGWSALVQSYRSPFFDRMTGQVRFLDGVGNFPLVLIDKTA